MKNKYLINNVLFVSNKIPIFAELKIKYNFSIN
jgi:hypothetical protein